MERRGKYEQMASVLGLEKDSKSSIVRQLLNGSIESISDERLISMTEKKKTNFKRTDKSDVVEDVDLALAMLMAYPCLRGSLDSYASLIKKRVIGQDETVDKLVYIAYLNQYINFLEEYTEESYGKRRSMFLIAPTGSGKTTMFRALEKVFNVPIYRANMTNVTSAGYIGEKVESFLLGLYERAGGDKAAAERGILLIDEIDKKSNVTQRKEMLQAKLFRKSF